MVVFIVYNNDLCVWSDPIQKPWNNVGYFTQVCHSINNTTTLIVIKMMKNFYFYKWPEMEHYIKKLVNLKMKFLSICKLTNLTKVKFWGTQDTILKEPTGE